MPRTIALLDWQSLTPGQHQALAKLRIAPEQEAFAGTIAQPIDACEAAAAETLRGFALLADSAVVGFLLLKRLPAAPQWSSL